MGPHPPKGTDEAYPRTAAEDVPSPFDELLQRVARTPDVTPDFPLSRDVAVGPFVGRFELIRPLGRGGFGVVYRARDTELGRHVAVKLLRLDRRGASDRAWLLDVFHREAEAAAKLNHPNIITIFDSGIHGGAPYLVLELLVGETLSSRLGRGPLPSDEAVAILEQICRGLAHAHAAGVIHRDLKPGNVFVREDGQVKILDFGLAHVAQNLTGGAVQEYVLGGTPAYMAPEQWHGQSDERTDVYACGIILFEMLCGRLPTDGSDRMANIPPDLVAITERSFATDPGDRYPSANELAAAVLRFAQREEGVTPAQPYRYLEQFTEADAPWFFGRDRDVVRLEQMVLARPLVALVGPSGAGKSSLVHAGLVPRLRRERTVVAMRPGNDPLRRLHERLVDVCGEDRVTRLLPDADHLLAAPGRAGLLFRAQARAASTSIVLIVDQLEELVTQVPTSAVRRAFAEALLSLADDAAGPIRVVVTVRGDFLGRLTQSTELREALARNMVLLGPPDADALAETLRRPAARLGFEYETGLVEEMVAAVADEAAPLPLVQLAASRLWERRDTTRRLLPRSGLAAAGGVAGILAAHANEVLDGLSGGDEVSVARRILCDLVTAEGTRRRARREDLLARFEDPGAAGRVLEHLVSGRLVTSTRADQGDWVELAHESLIAGWSLLQGWLDEDRADRQFRERLLAAAALWQERREPRELLWRSETLEEALRWRRRYPGSLSAAEQAFLSRAEAGARRARRVRRRLLVVGTAVAVAVTLGSLVSVRSYRAAAREARLREIVRTAGAADDPLVGALILAEFENQPEPPGGAAAAAQVAARPIPRVVYRGHDAPVLAGAFSRDGQWVATGASDGQVHVWRADGTRSPIVLKGHRGWINSVEFSPDGGRVLSASEDGTARIWHADGAGEPIVLPDARYARFTPDGAHVAAEPGVAEEGGVFLRIWPADGHGEPVVFRREGGMTEWDISADGSRVVAGGPAGVGLWRADGAPILFRPGRQLRARFSPDGSRILTYVPGCRVWRADLTLPVVFPGASRMRPGACAFTPDGQRVAYWNGRGVSVVAADGAGPAMEMTGAGSSSSIAGFSPDGSRVLTVGDANAGARLWWTDGRGEPLVLEGAVRDAALNHDGTRVLTVSYDGTARVWAVGDPPGVRFLRGHSDAVESVSVSGDGKLVLTASRDGTARVWPAGGGAPVVLGGVGPVKSAAFSPDGTRVATATSLPAEAVAGVGRVQVWPVAGGEPLAIAVPAGHFSRAVAFSPEGAWLASAAFSPPGVIVTRSDGSGEVVALKGGGHYASFSPDGSRLVAGGDEERVLVWRTDDWGAEPVVLQLSGAALGHSVFHPQGTMILTGADKVRLFSLDGRELVDLRRPGGPFVAWSLDGERIATGLGDGSARISRLDLSGETIVLRGHQGPVTGVAFTPDGRHLATGSADTTARLWLIDWGDLVRALRAATTACLTVDQRMTHLDDSPDKARSAWEACERRFGRMP